MFLGLLSLSAAPAAPCDVVSIDATDGRLLGEGLPANIGRAIAAGPALPGTARTAILIGAPSDEEEDTNAGATYVVGATVPAAADISEIATKVTGDRPGLRSGSAVAADTRLWVGAPSSGGDRGALYVLDWPPMEPTLEEATRILGEDTANRLGTALASGRSPFGPGTAVAAGAPEAGTGGRVYVFATGTTPTSLDDADLVVSDLTPGEQLGAAITLGDLDGDGWGDLAIGAPAVGPGHVYVFYGPRDPGTSLDIRDADAVIEGDQPGDRAGASLTAATGVYGGPSGIAVGATLAQNGLGEAVGRVCWFEDRLEGLNYLSEAPLCVWGTEPGGRVGDAVAAGDVNADGFTDLWIGAPEIGEGEAHLFLGPATGQLRLAQSDGRVVGVRVGDAVGAALAVIGDRDLDGYADTLVGAPGFGTSGAVALVRGGFCPPVDDVDRDGAPAAEDCDDLDASRSPLLAEDPCNGFDDDCDGTIDEIEEPRFADVDGDGFGDPASPADCAPGSVPDATDCDDERADVFPGAPERCGDGIDSDCSGSDDCPDVRGCLGSGGTFGALWLPLLGVFWTKRTPRRR